MKFGIFIFFGLLSSIFCDQLPPDFCDKKPMYSPYPNDCTRYVICAGPIGAHVLTCPDGLHWDRQRKICNWKKYANCVRVTTTKAPTTTLEPGVTTQLVTEKVNVVTVAKGLYGRARDCDETACRLPFCACSKISPPNKLKVEKVPQMILFTMDDGISQLNFEYYKQLFDNKKNPNGCPLKATFFVSGDSNDYLLTRDLYNRGHEIAVHTLSQRAPSEYWKTASYETYVTEIVGMKKKLESYGIKNIVGYRTPFLQTAGDTTYSVLKDYGFLYDSSIPSPFGKMVWPYTFDYDNVPKPCPIEPCPKNAYPGLWEIPLIKLRDTLATCNMFDQCHRYKESTADAVYEFFKENFDRHYKISRAPFPLFGHYSWVNHPAFNYRKEGFLKFLNEMLLKEDVYFVTMSQAIAWMKNPTDLDNIKKFKPWGC